MTDQQATQLTSAQIDKLIADLTPATLLRRSLERGDPSALASLARKYGVVKSDGPTYDESGKVR